MKLLLKNGYVLTMNPQGHVYTQGDVLVEDSKITAVGHFETPVDCDEVYDCTGKIVMPSLVNTHVHTSQQLARGLADDVTLLTWLHDRIWPYESNLTEEDSYVSTLLCCAEQIRCGCTSIAEPGGQHVAGMVKGVTQAGIRAKLAKSTMDCGEGLPAVWQKTTQEELDTQTELLERFRGANNGKIDVWYGLRTIFNNTDNLICRTKELADKYQTGIHMHVAEVKEEVEFAQETRGATTVQHLEDLGVLDKNFLAVHTVWLTDHEVDLFAKRQVKVSHNPASAMRVLGFAKVPQMLEKGVCVTIGTDGAPTNNRMDMVDEMYTTSLIHKAYNGRSDLVKAQEILAMATIRGAEALMDGDKYGSLEVGKEADLIVINPDSVGMLPMHDTAANLVTSMHSSNVESTLCGGQWLMKHRVLLTIDETALLEEAKSRATAIRTRAGIVMPQRFNLI